MKIMIDRSSVVQALKISAHQMANLLPIFIGVILCIGLFTAFILAIYGALFTITPDKTIEALGSSGKIFLHIAAPVTLVFCIIVVINLFLKPTHVASFLGRESGITGMVFSAVGGIISMGPIYAWYPLLKDLREKGAANILIAIFLGNRANFIKYQYF